MTLKISISIVSHGHGDMVSHLVRSIASFAEVSQIIITKNIPEDLDLLFSEKILIIDNDIPIGFGANHNQAFSIISEDSDFFCVLNPDIILNTNPFPALINMMRDSEAALSAPLVLNSFGEIEDSARFFPRVGSLVSKLLFKQDGRHIYGPQDEITHPEWIAGMFMLFRATDYSFIKGFDEHFFLYYEDVDICARMWINKLKIILCPKVSVIHNAQRHSRKSFKFMKWHLTSMLFFLVKHFGRLPSIKNLYVTNE